MRLKEAHVQLVCQKLLGTLLSKQLINLKKSEGEVLEKMKSLFLMDLKAEDELLAEAKRILEQFEAKAGGAIDKDKMLQMIKKQLAKDKGMVL